MKLMIIIVSDNDSESVVQELVQENFRVTRMSSSGGFLRRGNSTLLVGVEDEQVEAVTNVLKRACGPAEGAANSGHQYRATVFVVNMAHYAKI